MQHTLTYPDCTTAMVKDDVNFFLEVLGDGALSTETLQLILKTRDVEGRTFLMRSLAYYSINVARVLLQSQLDLDITATDKSGLNALQYAFRVRRHNKSMHGNIDIVSALLNYVYLHKIPLDEMTKQDPRFENLSTKYRHVLRTESRIYFELVENTNRSTCLPKYTYVPFGNWHALIKHTAQMNYTDKQNSLEGYYENKVHLSLSLDHHESVQAWSILLQVFQDPCVHEVKLIDPDTSMKSRQPGKEAVIYFTARKDMPRMNDAEFLARHINVMRKTDKLIQLAKLTPSVAPVNYEESELEEFFPIEEYSTKNLGCHTGALYISPPDRAMNKETGKLEYVSSKTRVTPKNHPYTGECVVLQNMRDMSSLLSDMLADHFAPDARLPGHLCERLINFKRNFKMVFDRSDADDQRILLSALQSAHENKENVYHLLQASYLVYPALFGSPFYQAIGHNEIYTFMHNELDALRESINLEHVAHYRPGPNL